LSGLLILTAATGAAGLIAVDRARAAESAMRARYRQRSEALEKLRVSILLAGSVASDYFAASEAPDGPGLKARLSQLQQDSRDALAGGAASASLRGEVNSWWKFLDLMSGMASRPRSAALEAYFRGQLSDRRAAMLRIAGEIGETMTVESARREADLAWMYGRFQWFLAGELLLVVLAGAALSVAAVNRLAKLEGETRALGAQLLRAQEQERRSIARELHDEVGQSLTALRLDIGASRLDKATAEVERIVEEVRRIALSLRPSMLDDLGLVAALEWQAREVSGRSGVSVEVMAEESAGRLPDAQKTCIYRVAQEALQNSVRHARAGKIRIGLERNGAAVRLCVEDNGHGFTPARNRGMGLLGMEERVSQLGGRFKIVSAPGDGTTVTAELPL
jgi:signal transduction histidine kinase